MLKYVMIADEVRAQIKSGAYTDGARLPIEDAMMASYGVSRQTIRKAMDVLESEGLVMRKRGSGTFVSRPRKTMQRTGLVGVLATDISGYIFPLILRGIEKTLTRSGYMVALRSTRNHLDAERQMLLYYLENPVDGLIVDGTRTALPSPNIDLYRKIQASGVPMVFINGVYRELTDAVCVSMDDEGGAKYLTNYLISRGCSRLGGLFQLDYAQGPRRYAGFTRACVEAGLPILERGILWFDNESKKNPLQPFRDPARFETIRDLDGVLCFNDIFSCDVINLYQSMGAAVPMVAGFDNMLPTPFPLRGYITLPHAKEEMGVAAAEKLLALLRGEGASSATLPWGRERLADDDL